MADSSKDIQLRELKDMISDLKKMIKTLQATVDAANKREEALTQERDNLKEEIDLLRKKLFGTSSEKRVLDIPGQRYRIHNGGNGKSQWSKRLSLSYLFAGKTA